MIFTCLFQSDRSIIPEFAWKDWDKPRRTSIRTAGVPIGIQTEHLPNMSQEDNPCASSFGIYCSVYTRCYAMNVRWADISDPLLGNGSVNTFLRQRLHMQQGKRGDATRSARRGYKRRTKSVEQTVQLWDGCQPGTIWAREAEESPLLTSVTRKRLVKTLQAGEGLACSAVICKFMEISGDAVITCTYESCV
jgi:hypothetical protein